MIVDHAAEIADVAVSANGEIYALCRFPGRVVVLEASGRLSHRFGEGTLSNKPHGISVAPDGRVFVVDAPEHVVRIFTAAGIGAGVLGSPGRPSDTGVDTSGPVPSWTPSVSRSAPPFNHPTKVAVTSAGESFVSDGYGNARVHRFDTSGRLIRSWGDPGSGPGQFMLPHAVTELANGQLLVCDRENDRLQFFDGVGGLIQVWTGVQRPCAAAQDDQHRIWVAELPWQRGERSHRRGIISVAESPGVRLLDAVGETVTRLSELPSGTELLAPHGLAIGPEALYVAEVGYSLTGRPSEQSLHVLPRAE